MSRFLVPRGPTIRHKRKLRGFTLPQLAAETHKSGVTGSRGGAGLSDVSLGKIERGELKQVFPPTARMIAAALAGIEASAQDVDQLMTELFEFPEEDASVR